MIKALQERQNQMKNANKDNTQDSWPKEHPRENSNGVTKANSGAKERSSSLQQEDITVSESRNNDNVFVTKSHVEFISNEEDYMVFVKYADYSSDLTKVVSISKSKIHEIRIESPHIFEKYFSMENIKDKEIKPLLKFDEDKNVFVLERYNEDILAYLNIWSGMNPVVKYASFPRIFKLLEQDLIDISEEAKNKLSYVDNKTKISELISSELKTKHYGNFFSFKKNMGEDELGVLELDKVQVIRNKVFILSNLIVSDFSSGDKEALLINPKNGAKYKVKFYKLTESLKRVLSKGREISIMVDKVLGSYDSGYKVINPTIVPKGFKASNREYAKCPRMYPSDCYNALYYEYKYRNSIKKL